MTNKIEWEQVDSNSFFTTFENLFEEIEAVGINYTCYRTDDDSDLNVTYGKIVFEDDDEWFLIDEILFYSEDDFSEQLFYNI